MGDVPPGFLSHSVYKNDFLTFLGRNTIEVRILAMGKILQESKMLVPDQKRGPQMSIFSSAERNMTTY